MRVALTEVVLKAADLAPSNTATARFAQRLEVFVYKRGTEEEAALYSTESGGEALAQPLTTDGSGRPVSEGKTAWVEEGSYDLVSEGVRVPWEASRGDTDLAKASKEEVEAEKSRAQAAEATKAPLDEDGEYLDPSVVPPSVETDSAITAEPTVYVSKNGNDGNAGISWQKAFLTVGKAIEHLEALSGGTGVIEVGKGNFSEGKLVRPSNCVIRGRGIGLTTITLKAAQNTNVIEDASWGSTTTVGSRGGVEKLTVNGNKANQTLASAQTFLTATATVSGAATTLNVVDGSTFNAAGLTAGTLWLGNTRCEYTGLEDTGVPFDPSNPKTTGWKFTGVKAVGGGSRTYYPEALVLPGKQWGHGIAIQSFAHVLRDVLIEECSGSGRAYQGPGGGSSSFTYETKEDNVRAQRCNRYDLEVGPSASDGMASQVVGANGAMGSMLVMSENWEYHATHLSGVSTGAYNGRNAPHAITICASKQRFYGLFLDSFPLGQICINTAWIQANIRSVHFDGDVQLASLAASGAGNGIAFYGQQDPGTLTVFNVKAKMGLRSRLLHAMVFQPTTEIALAAGAAEWKTPSKEAEGASLQVLNCLEFSPLGSAIAGTVQLTSSAGAALDTISYTGRSAATVFLAAAATAGATTLEVDDASSLASSGTIALYPAATTEAAVEAMLVTYTKKTGNVLEGIPAAGNGRITENLAVGTGATQHFLTGVKSTGAGGVSIPDTTTAYQTGGATGRQAGTVTGTLETDTAYHRRTGALTYPGTGANLRIAISGRILDFPNPFQGSVEIKVGETVGEVSHNLSTTPAPGFYGATPTTFPQKEYKVEVTSTKIKVTLKEAAAGSAVKFNVWAAISLV